VPNKFTHIDCFSGVGGICTGLHAAGFNTLLAIEHIQSCVDTYRANHKNVKVIHNDITKVKAEDILSFINCEVDLVTSGMPCETFSTAGSTSRSFYDDRQYLFKEGIRIAKIVNAKMILFENVPAMTTKLVEKNGSRLIIDELFDELVKEGYKYYVTTILNSADFGVPQYRDRFFVLASRFDWNLTVPIAQGDNHVTVGDALFDIPNVQVNSKTENRKYLNRSNEYTALMKNDTFWKLGKTTKELTYHKAPNHREGTIERFTYIKQGEGLKNLFSKFSSSEIEELQKRKVLPRKWYIQRNRRLIENSPCPTVTSHCLDEFIHPIHDRALTVREVARLQSFPDSYDFAGGSYICPHNAKEQDKYEQIGDSVPPLLSYAWGMVIKKILEENK